MNTYKLSATDRCVINRFLLSVGTRIKFSTNCIRQPLTMKLVEDALKKVEENAIVRAKDASKILDDFDNGNIPKHIIAYFGKDVKREDLEEYVRERQKQELDTVNSIKNSYMVWVDNEFWGDDRAKALHKSFNPRVTFGYSNQLHEECDVPLTNEIRALLIKSELGKLCRFNAEQFSYGSFTLKEISCSFYEDTKIFIGDRLVMESISHEQMYDVYLTEDDISLFRSFEGKQERNEKIIKKLV